MMEPTDHDPTTEGDTCPDCDGSGTVEVDDCDSRGEHVSRSEPCPTCGSGSRDEDEPDAERDMDAEADWEAPW